jgi:hypothetical protein
MRFAICILFLLLFLCEVSVAQAAENKLKLPDYYLGAWNGTAENHIYVIKDNGTITGYFDFGKKEKYTDMTYRVLDVQQDYVALFVRQVDVNDPFTGKSPADTFYEYWTLKLYERAYSPGEKRMWIETANFERWDKPVNPDQKSDKWLLNYYNERSLYMDFSAKYGYYRLPPGSFKE